jgi:carbon-monoxide dehydrogenase small subunit
LSEKFLRDDNGIQRFLVTVNVNGIDYTKMVKANMVLVNFLRDELDLTGTKRGCEMGDCGSCTVLVDGKPMNSCLMLVVEAEGKKITTIEGVSTTENLSDLQEKFLEYGAIQCGYCSAGMILSAKALLTDNPHPTYGEVQEGISGNICRCTGYVNIIRAILAASGQEVENY